MSITIDLRFKYTQEEYASALRAYMVRSSRLRFGFVLSLFLLSMGLLAVVAGIDSSLSFLLISVSIFYLIVILMALFVVPQKRFRDDPRFRDEYFLEFSEEGIQFKTAQLDSTIKWSLYTKFIETRRFYLLVYGQNMISAIPKRAFSEPGQEAIFRNLLSRKIAPGSHSKQLEEETTDALEKEYVPPSEMPDWR